MIHVIATIEVEPGRRADFLAEFAAVVGPSRAEPGCLEYGAAVDTPSGHPAQPPVRPDVVVVVEKWADLAALQAHQSSPHMAAYRPRVAGLVRSVSLQVLEPVG